MKNLKLILIGLFLFYYSSLTYCQLPQGKAKLIKFTNTSELLKVPEGKTWYITSAFSSHNYKPFIPEIANIYIKSINGAELTNFETNLVGPCIFSYFTSTMVNVNFPIALPEGSTISFIIVKHNMQAFWKSKEADFTGYVSIIETDIH